MVQAIDAKRKNQTRRLKGLELINKNPDIYNRNGDPMKRRVRIFDSTIEDNPNPLESWFGFRNAISSEIEYVKCPYGQPGDVLWVRESFLINAIGKTPFLYRAESNISNFLKWKPSIHMPKEAARLFLQIKDIRVERLRDISESDAIGEGIECLGNSASGIPIWKEYFLSDINANFAPENSFRSLWKKINGEDSWNSNPWVWVIEFKKIERPENFI